MAACCIDPNFKDADFQAKKGVRGAEDLINLVLNPGQYTDLLLAVQEIKALPRRERAFIYASIDLQIEKEKKEAAKAKRRKGKKGR